MADPDELYTLRNRFWLGNFQMAIAEGNNLNRLSDKLVTERDEFVYRCYIGLGQYKLVISAVKDTAEPSLRAVKLLAQYMMDPAENGESVKATLVEWLADPSMSGCHTLHLIAALIYEKEDMMNEAFKAVNNQSTMEMTAFYAQLCLKIFRVDLAEKIVKKLMEADEDATLTQLVSAWVGIAKGGKGLKEAAFAYEELIDKFEPTLMLLNGLACCNLHQHNFEEAETHLVQALSKSHNDPDTLINIITCYHHMGKSAEIVDRYTSQLYEAAPNHPFVLKLKRAEAQFDRVAQQYALPEEDQKPVEA